MVIWVDISLNLITMEIYFKGASTRNTDFIKTVNFILSGLQCMKIVSRAASKRYVF